MRVGPVTPATTITPVGMAEAEGGPHLTTGSDVGDLHFRRVVAVSSVPEIVRGAVGV